MWPTLEAASGRQQHTGKCLPWVTEQIMKEYDGGTSERATKAAKLQRKQYVGLKTAGPRT